MTFQRTHADPRAFARCLHQDDGTGRCAGCRARSDPPFVQSPAALPSVAALPMGQMLPFVKAGTPAPMSDGTGSRAFVINHAKTAQRRAANRHAAAEYRDRQRAGEI